MKKNNLMLGAVILTLGGVMAKGFSAIYRIVLTRVLGGVGIGIYQLIFPIYSLFVVLTTAGLPLAISKVISKNKGKERAIIKKSMLYITIISFVLTLIMIVGSKLLAWFQGRSEIYICYIILSPSIMIVSAISVLRGYFQGINNFTPSAVSNIIEQFTKLAFGLMLSLILIQKSLIWAIIGAVVGIVLSEVVALLILIISYKISSRKLNKDEASLSFKELSKDIIPIVLTNIILPLSSFVDSILVVNLLKINFSNETAVFLYGLESGAVSSLVNLPTLFSFSIASVIMPSMSGKESLINKNYKLNISLKVVLLITIPCVVCFLLFPSQIIEVLYGSRLNSMGLNGNLISSKLLALSSVGAVGLVVNQVYSTSLQAVNYRKITIKNLALSVFVKFVLVVMFMPFKNINIYALAIANVVCYLLVMILNQKYIKKKFNVNIGFYFVGKIMISIFLMIVSILIFLLANPSISTIILSFILGALVYLISVFNFNIFTKKDMAVLKYKVK